MKYKTRNIDQEKLREELIRLYKRYVEIGPVESVAEKAKEKDGLWAGKSVLHPDIETALNNLTSMYVQPYLTAENARKILDGLIEQKER